MTQLHFKTTYDHNTPPEAKDAEPFQHGLPAVLELRNMARDGETRLVYSTDAPARCPARGLKKRKPSGGDRPSRKGGARVRLERRASDRVVTVVSGLPGSSPEVAALARELKAACGTGGTLKGGALELQGDQRERVESLLAARGVSAKRAGG